MLSLWILCVCVRALDATNIHLHSHISVLSCHVWLRDCILSISALDAKCLVIRLYCKNKIETREIIFFLYSVSPLGIQMWAITQRKSRNCLLGNVWDAFIRATNRPLVIYSVDSPFLKCSSFSVHLFTICASWGFICLDSLCTLFLCGLLSFLGDHWHVDNYLVYISGSWPM